MPPRASTKRRDLLHLIMIHRGYSYIPPVANDGTLPFKKCTQISDQNFWLIVNKCLPRYRIHNRYLGLKARGTNSNVFDFQNLLLIHSSKTTTDTLAQTELGKR